MRFDSKIRADALSLIHAQVRVLYAYHRQGCGRLLTVNEHQAEAVRKQITLPPPPRVGRDPLPVCAPPVGAIVRSPSRA